MKIHIQNLMKAAGTLWIAAVIVFAFVGNRATADDKAVTASNVSESIPKLGKSGSQLWSENCARCHNMRSPSAYSDAEWSVVMHHMRVRAQLTAEEHKAILEFLKSAN